MEQIIDIFHEGYENYKTRNWERAKSYFNQALAIDRTDGPSKAYLKRCDQFLTVAPPDDWDGVYTMLKKG